MRLGAGAGHDADGVFVDGGVDRDNNNDGDDDKDLRQRDLHHRPRWPQTERRRAWSDG